jgi:hypothetical protein
MNEGVLSIRKRAKSTFRSLESTQVGYCEFGLRVYNEYGIYGEPR